MTKKMKIIWLNLIVQLRGYIMSLLNFIKAKKVIKNWSDKSIVIFSEGNIYNTTNQPVINELIKEIEVLYITIDKEDKLLSFNHSKFHPVYLEFDFWGQFLMATLKGRLLITTTPSLNVLALKKSPNIQHHSCFMHAPVDIHYYQKNSFDFFDSIVCAGEYQVDTLKKLEEKRGTPVKEKIVLGVPYLDKYYNEYQNNNSIQEHFVLISPSWGANNFLNKINYDVFKKVFSYGYNIIFRPHPMSLKYEKELIDKILALYGNGFNGLKFIFDNAPSGIESMKKSEFMISATSGVIIDYILIAEKQVIIMNEGQHDISNLEKPDIDTIPWEDKLINDTCAVINSEEEFDSFFKTYSQNNSKLNILQYKNNISNLGDASKKIASYYINKFN